MLQHMKRKKRIETFLGSENIQPLPLELIPSNIFASHYFA